MSNLIENPITGIINSATDGVKKVVEVFKPNAEAAAQRDADEQMAIMRAYQAEFHNRDNRSWVDALADAVNRLVRPVITISIIAIFFVAYISPTRFAEITLALSSVPNGYWALLSTIIAFYFGGRMQLKSQDFRFQESQAKAVKALIETKKEFRKLEMDSDEPDRLIGDQVAKDPQTDIERQAQSNPIVEYFLELDKKDNVDVRGKLIQQVEKIRQEPVEEMKKRSRIHPKRRRR